MKTSSLPFVTGFVICIASVSALAQQAAPAATPPNPGLVNSYLREGDSTYSNWDIGGAARGRYDSRHAYGIQGVAGSVDFRENNVDVNNEYFLERIRVRVGYTDQQWGALVELEDSHAQSDERYAYANNPAVAGTEKRKSDGPEADVTELHQAYLTVGNLKTSPLLLKIGRQEMSYGDERLIGTFGWNNIGRTFDAVKVRWQNDLFGVDLFVSRPVIPENYKFDKSNKHDYLSGFYGTSLKFIPGNIFDFYFLSRNSSRQAAADEPSPQFPQPSARDIYTPGFRIKSKPGEFGPWDYSLESAYQFGSYQDARTGANTPTERLGQSAYMVVAQGGYTFAGTWATPRLGLEFDYSSGDRDPFDDKHETFDNLFPTNHKFYGYMDFVSLQNIQDLRLSLALKPMPKLSVTVEGHSFWLANTHDSFYNVAGAARGGTAPTPGGVNYGINPGYSSSVGQEIDVVATYLVTGFAQVEAGYGHFFTGDYVEQSLADPAYGSQDANFIYAQVNVNF